MARWILRQSDFKVLRMFGHQGQRIYKCPTVRRRTGEDAYTPECIEAMQANFHDHIRKGASTTKVTTYKGTIRTDDQPKTVERDNQLRSVRIRAEYLDTYTDSVQDAPDAPGIRTG